MKKFSLKLCVVSYIIILLLGVANALVFQSETRTYNDPIPEAIDDESTIVRKNYGKLLPLAYKETKECYCAPEEDANTLKFNYLNIVILDAIAIVAAVAIGAGAARLRRK